MARILVTGASGYIGQHLCLTLAGSTQVRGLSRSVRPPQLVKLEWVLGDITDIDIVVRAVAGCQAVVHLVCLPLPQSAQDPGAAQRVNTLGTLTVLEAARRTGVERFIYTSTSQVYGGQAPLPNVETCLPQPDSAYAASKLSGEIWAETYARLYHLPIQILRLFNVYGPRLDRQPRSSAEAMFFQSLQQRQRPIVQGHPASGRDFIHIHDVIRAIQLALTMPVGRGPVNIGTGTLTTFVDLARLAIQVAGQTMEPEILETGAAPVRFQADTARAQKLLDFQAEIPLATGLRHLAATL
jgi:UDP-glucose 4-epimerase